MFAYRFLISIFAAMELGRAARRGGPAALAGRLGRSAPAPGPERHVWLHGASNGELASARPVLERLLLARPELGWLVTCNSETGRALVEGWDLPHVSVRPAPLDLARVSRKMMRDWRVTAHVALEAEIWPHRVIACPGPVILLGARMSAGTARSWARFPRTARRVLGRVAYASAQDAASRDRLLALGLHGCAAGPVVDLKAFYEKPDAVPDAALRGAFPPAQTWLAASTHRGEEEVVLDAQARLLAASPDLRLILAPRHPERADAVAALVRDRGLTLARRSHGETPHGVQVYLADTLGEMALWYALAGRVFVGGSLVHRGGHTPYEPAAFGAALIHGPDMRNFAAAHNALRDAGIAREAGDAAALADIVASLADTQRAVGAAQAQTLRPRADPDTLVAELLARVSPGFNIA